MTINEKIEGVLNTVTIDNEIVPYYYGMPEFDESPPLNYIVYDVYEIPLYQGDGKYPRKKYNATINIFTAEFNMQLLYDVESAFNFGGLPWKIPSSHTTKAPSPPKDTTTYSIPYFSRISLAASIV